MLGFAAGAAAGWAAGLLRRPASAPAGSSADEAIHLPREDFGVAEAAPAEEPAPAVAEHAPPRKATAPSVRPTPGSHKTAATTGDAEPAKPARRRTAKAPDPAEAAAAALCEGHAEVAERLAGAEAEATPTPAPAPRRRRRPPV